jgi:drug/metabolite transporter (DMT)-like permease
MNSENLKIFLGFLLICAIWGSTWLVIRLGLDSFTPIFAAGMRFLLAAVLFFIIMKLNKVKLQTDTLSIKLYFIMGFFSFVFPFGLVYWAEQYIASGLTSVLFTIFPFLVIIFSKMALPNEQIGIFKVIGTSIGFAGIYFIFSDDISMDINEDIWGMLAIIGSATLQAAIAVTIKKYGGSLHPLSMNFVPVLIAGVVMIPAGLILEDSSSLKFDLNALFSISYLALFGTVATFTTYYWLMKRMNIVILSLNSLVSPIIAVFLGWLILSENFSVNDIVGSSLVLFGLLLANTRGLANYYKKKRVPA